jgi:hypothetical protein
MPHSLRYIKSGSLPDLLKMEYLPVIRFEKFKPVMPMGRGFDLFSFADILNL